MKKKLQEAIQLSKLGDKGQARRILRELVDESPENLNAWFWLVDAMPTDEERIQVLQEAVSHHSNDRRLAGALEKLLSEQESTEEQEVSFVIEVAPVTSEEDAFEMDTESDSSVDLYEEDFVEEEDDEEIIVDVEAAKPVSSSSKKQTNRTQYLFIVFVLFIAALAVAWLFRDSWFDYFSPEETPVVLLPSATETLTVASADEGPESTMTFTPVPTATEVPPTATQVIGSAEDGTPTPILLTTPTNTAVVEEGKFVSVVGSQINDISWSQDGEYFAVAGDGGIAIYDGETFTEKLHITLDPVVPVLTICFSGDGEYIAAGFDQASSGEELITRARMWRVSDGAEVMSFDYNAPRGDIDTLAFSSDGETLLMNAKLDAVLKWRVSDGALLDAFLLSASEVNYYGVVFSPDRLSFATYSKFDRVRIYDTLFGEQLSVLGEEKDIEHAVFSENNQYLAVMFEEQPTVLLWDLPSEEKIKEWNTFGGNVTTLAFDADNQTLAVGTDEDLIKFYQIRSGEEQRVISRQIPSVSEMEFAPDDILFAVRNEKEIQIWHLLTDTLVATFRVEK